MGYKCLLTESTGNTGLLMLPSYVIIQGFGRQVHGVTDIASNCRELTVFLHWRSIRRRRGMGSNDVVLESHSTNEPFATLLALEGFLVICVGLVVQPHVKYELFSGT